MASAAVYQQTKKGCPIYGLGAPRIPVSRMTKIEPHTAIADSRFCLSFLLASMPANSNKHWPTDVKEAMASKGRAKRKYPARKG